ncbi:MAG: hypothetical protein IJG15_02960 [Lachnospiraceae bacterium]|nr:hypothetical protein [Lachnospiraceae bacterium]
MHRFLKRGLIACLAAQICLTGVTAFAEEKAAATADPAQKEAAPAAQPAAPAQPAAQAAQPAPAPAPKPAAGVWKLTQMTLGESTITTESLKESEALGEVCYMELREDGTATFYNLPDDEDGAGTWDAASIVLDSGAAAYMLGADNNTLNLQAYGSTMAFERTTREAVYAILGYKEGVLDANVKYVQEDKKILSTDDVRVKITGYKADMKGFTVKLHCDNKGEHKTVISADNSAVNKYNIETAWSVSLGKDESCDSEILFPVLELEKLGITAVDELTLRLSVYDGKDGDVLSENSISTVYPTGKKADQVVAPERKPVDKEAVVVNDAACTFILQGPVQKDAVASSIPCYIENKTDKVISLVLENSTVNGQPVEGFVGMEILPGTRGYSSVLYMQDALAAKGITDITGIAATLKVYARQESSLELVSEAAVNYAP